MNLLKSTRKQKNTFTNEMILTFKLEQSTEMLGKFFYLKLEENLKLVTVQLK